MDHQLRRKRLAARLPDLGIEALLVTRPPNVRYLTGFTGSNGQVLVAPDASVFFTDGRYVEQSSREVPDLERVAYQWEFTVDIVERCRAIGVGRLGFEAAGVTFQTHRKLSDHAQHLELTAVGEEVERLRRVKEEEEIRLIERAQEATDAAFDEILGRIEDGVTERELALELELAMRRAGADGLAFDPIVAFGEQASEPHHEPSTRPLRPGDVVKLDFGARCDGYHADMTRTVAFGEPPSELRDIHELVRRAQRAGFESLRAGVPARDVDLAARRVIEEAGRGDGFCHSLGHGVGLEIHEGPWLRKASDDVLPAGTVVTVEPGIYVPGLGGVRVEDMVEVTDDGCRVIPRSTRELVVV